MNLFERLFNRTKPEPIALNQVPGENSEKNRIEEICDIALNIGQKQNFGALIKCLKESFIEYNLTTTERIDLVLKVNSFYMNRHKGDEAFSLLQMVCEISVGLKKFYFLFYNKEITANQAKMCLSERKYSDYLFYFISSFLISRAMSITVFPYMESFFEKKHLSYKENWWFEIDENRDIFNDALKQVNIKQKQALLNDIFNYAYKKLPLIMGVPEEYLLNEKKYLELTDLDDDVSDEKRLEILDKQMAIGRAMEAIPNMEHALIGVFVSKVLKKYHDLQ